MKARLVFFFLFCPVFLFAKPYHAEYIENQRDKQFLVIFHGQNVSEENEPAVKFWERKYMEHENGDFLEYKHMRFRLEEKLNSLGVSVEVIENPDWRFSEKVSPSAPSRRREIKCVSKDRNGNIIAIAGDWGIITVEEAIREINSGTYEYYVNGGIKDVSVHVVSGRYLRTDPDETSVNNLDSLPECR